MYPKITVTNTRQLNDQIARLEIRAAQQKEAMIVSFDEVKETLKPMNLLKQTLSSTFTPGKKNDLIGTALGLGSGLLGRKLLFGKSSGILGKLFGAAVEFGLGGIVAKNADRIKSGASEWLEQFLPKKKSVRPKSPLGNGTLQPDRSLVISRRQNTDLVNDPRSTAARPADNFN